MISSQLNWIMFANFCKNLLTLQLKSIPHIRHMHHMWCRCQNFKPVVGRGQVLSLNICPAPPFTEHLVMFLKKWLPACYQWPTRSYILHPTCPANRSPSDLENETAFAFVGCRLINSQYETIGTGYWLFHSNCNHFWCNMSLGLGWCRDAWMFPPGIQDGRSQLDWSSWILWRTGL